MKILQVIPYFVPAWGYGGPIPVCYELSKKLVENGHSVTVCTTDALDNNNRINVRKERIDGIDVLRFRNISNHLAWYHNLFIPIEFTDFIKNNLKSYDIVHLHDYRTPLNVILHRYATKYGIPYILQPHGTTHIILKKHGLKKLFDKKFGYKIIKKAGAILALNETEAKNLERMGAQKNKIKIVPNGIDVRKFNDLPPKGIFRKKYSIRENEKLILYVGRIHKSKGIDILIESFANLLLNLPDSTLVLLGPDDGYMEEMKNIVNKLKIGKNVIFTGFVNSKIKMAAYADADVFVTPNFTGFPITFLEGMFFGLPIITTDKGDKLDWIHNKVGFVAEYDKNQLKDSMFEILNDEELKRRFGEEGKRLVREKFGWDKVVLDVEKIYLSVIE
ncbi:MAG: glycosyl transferase [Thermotoga sp.]|nr:MAG: glycosyl transferase [Thermotoga sp.]